MKDLMINTEADKLVALTNLMSVLIGIFSVKVQKKLIKAPFLVRFARNGHLTCQMLCGCFGF